nr:hypothetical protein [Actinomycetota bacterium]
GGRDLRAQHNLAYWQGRDYLGIGVGAVSTIRGIRRRNRPRLRAYIAALRDGEPAPAETEVIDAGTLVRERLMLGLRLDEPLALADVENALDEDAVERFVAAGLVVIGSSALSLTRRGRFLGGGVTADLMREPPEGVELGEPASSPKLSPV